MRLQERPAVGVHVAILVIGVLPPVRHRLACLHVARALKVATVGLPRHNLPTFSEPTLEREPVFDRVTTREGEVIVLVAGQRRAAERRKGTDEPADCYQRSRSTPHGRTLPPARPRVHRRRAGTLGPPAGLAARPAANDVLHS